MNAQQRAELLECQVKADQLALNTFLRFVRDAQDPEVTPEELKEAFMEAIRATNEATHSEAGTMARAWLARMRNLVTAATAVVDHGASGNNLDLLTAALNSLRKR